LHHLDSKNSVQKEGYDSHHVESKEEEADQFLVLGTVKIKENLGENEAGAHELEHDILVLLESVLSPALHGESLNAGPVNLVRVVLVSKSEV